MIRKSLSSLLLLSVSLAHAQPSVSPEEVIKATTDEMVEQLGMHPGLVEDPGSLFALVNAVVLPRFDFDRISGRVLGRYWRRASDDQRRQFISAFRTLLLRTYAVAFASYDYQNIIYHPARTRSETEVSVRTEITRAKGSGIPINYEMHLRDGSWKIYDVAVDGVSLSLTYRNDFASVVRQQGIDALIARLVAHNSQT